MSGKKDDKIFSYHLTLEEEYPFLKSHRELKPLFEILRVELQRHLRPASETILFDEHVMKILGIEKRKLQYLKAQRKIPFKSPPFMQRDYYYLSEILAMLDEHNIEPVQKNCRI